MTSEDETTAKKGTDWAGPRLGGRFGVKKSRSRRKAASKKSRKAASKKSRKKK
jgi:hypothetical protein